MKEEELYPKCKHSALLKITIKKINTEIYNSPLVEDKPFVLYIKTDNNEYRYYMKNEMSIEMVYKRLINELEYGNKRFVDICELINTVFIEVNESIKKENSEDKIFYKTK